jgi:glycosyltransferase involved in cell wall biosynthesis
MPVFNAEPFVAEAVESVLGQTFVDFEVIAVDDSSDDGSRAVLERFAESDARVRVIALDVNGGVARAFNRGCAAARGRYLAFLGADDVSLPDRLARQVAFLDANPPIAVVGSAAITIDNAGNRGSLLRFPTTSRVIRTTLLDSNCLAHSSVLMRREVFDLVGGFRFRVCEDYDLWLRIAERYPLANLTDALVLYRFHGGQLSFLGSEEMERTRLAVRAAAQIRSAGRPDPLNGVDAVTVDVAASLGVRERDVARAMRMELFSRAAILAELDRHEAEELVANASRKLGRGVVRGFHAARELRRAEALLSAGKLIAGSTHVVRAMWQDPVYAGSRIAARLTSYARIGLAR